MTPDRRQFIAVATAAVFAPRMALAAEKTSVAVVGGGLAGLHAALLLQDQGADVLLLEGTRRIGGRVFTADDVETRPEFGASQIGRSYARTLDLCRRFGLTLAPETRDLLPMSNHVRGAWVKSTDWESSPVNRLVGEERKLAPALLGSQLMAKYNPLQELDDWLSPAHAGLDISFAELLKRHGHSPEALRLADISTTGNDLVSASCLSMMQEQTRGRFEQRFGGDVAAATDRPYGFRENPRAPGELAAINNIVGGTSRLTDAMAKALGERVRTGKIVRAIDMSGAKAEIACLDGSRFSADYVVAAIPFTTLRRVQVTPAFEGAQAEAVALLPYAHTTRGFGVIEAPYWEADGLEPSFFTDETVEMLWALKPRPGESFHRFMVVLTGDSAARIDQLPSAEARALIEAEIARMRPATRGKLKLVALYGWRNAPLIGGCRHMFAPGQVTRFAAAMIKPHHRLHLAGEHTRRLDFGMEAALESGERAAVEIMEKMA